MLCNDDYVDDCQTRSRNHTTRSDLDAPRPRAEHPSKKPYFSHQSHTFYSPIICLHTCLICISLARQIVEILAVKVPHSCDIDSLRIQRAKPQDEEYDHPHLDCRIDGAKRMLYHRMPITLSILVKYFRYSKILYF